MARLHADIAGGLSWDPKSEPYRTRLKCSPVLEPLPWARLSAFISRDLDGPLTSNTAFLAISHNPNGSALCVNMTLPFGILVFVDRHRGLVYQPWLNEIPI
jgi:hypothetical protein